MTVSLTALARSARDTCSGAFCDDAQDRKGGTSQWPSIGYTKENNKGWKPGREER
jgi:hypothetical protein